LTEMCFMRKTVGYTLLAHKIYKKGVTTEGLKFMIKKIYPLHCCLPREISDVQFKVFMAEK